MHKGQFIFAQISGFLPMRIFDKCVFRYEGNKHTRHFKCWNQMMCMMFGQLSNRDSLRDLITCIEAHPSKYYHLGFGKNVSRSNLAKANENRNYKVYEDYAYEIIKIARSECINDKDFALSLEGNVYALDATVIDLCLSVFWWATFRENKGAVKVHTLYDVKTSIPSFIHITSGEIHEVNGMDYIEYESGAYYIMDRGYLDFKRLFCIELEGAYFITRAKVNTQYVRISSDASAKGNGVICDQIIHLAGFYPKQDYPGKLRRIKYYDKVQKRTLVFLTNNFNLEATIIADLYRHRWKIELFFKWIKQHLKIKSFWGSSENAVKTQIYIAIITYSLIAIIKSRLMLEKRTTYEILQIIGVSLLDKTPLIQLLKENTDKRIEYEEHKQLKLSLI